HELVAIGGEKRDYRAVAHLLPADKLARWFEDPKLPDDRRAFIGFLLGHCGTEEHARLLAQRLEYKLSKAESDTDGLLIGFTQLRPKEGWGKISALVQNDKKSFILRYQCLRAIRYFWETRPEVIERKDLLEAMGALLNQGDIADLPIENLRKWQNS